MPASGCLRVPDEQLQPKQPLPPRCRCCGWKGQHNGDYRARGGKTDKADEKQAAEKAKNDEKKNEKSDSKKGTQISPFGRHQGV